MRERVTWGEGKRAKERMGTFVVFNAFVHSQKLRILRGKERGKKRGGGEKRGIVNERR